MKRYLHDRIVSDVKRKMVLLTGPRQVGKTFMAKDIATAFAKPAYLNYDSVADMAILRRQSWPTASDLLIFDEIHKMREWKSFVKGVYDTRPAGQCILITGSARLDTFRQSGESLAGRYYRFRLHPLSVAELTGVMRPDEAVEALNRLGGFPEPLLSGSEVEAQRWRNQYYTDLVREDIVEFGRLHEIRQMRLLVDMLRARIGAPLSYTSLAGDLQLAPNTVRRYVEILESLHIVFLVRPHHANVARAIQKEPKLYFYDTGYVTGDEGTRLENTVAVCLRKHVDFMMDANGCALDLRYVRTKENHEVDFALARDGRLEQLIEVKLADATPAKGLRYLAAKLPDITCLQLVHHLRQEETRGRIQLLRLGPWLAGLSA